MIAARAWLQRGAAQTAQLTVRVQVLAYGQFRPQRGTFGQPADQLPRQFGMLQEIRCRSV